MYGTSAGGDTYFTTRSFDRDSIWSSASDNDKEIALNEATSLIDNLNFAGDKHDEDQENEFPRGDDEVVPTAIEYAAYEIARNILAGRDIDLENETLDAVGVIGSKHEVKRERNISEAKAHAIPSEKAWRLIKPYLREATITFSRVD